MSSVRVTALCLGACFGRCNIPWDQRAAGGHQVYDPTPWTMSVLNVSFTVDHVCVKRFLPEGTSAFDQAV